MTDTYIEKILTEHFLALGEPYIEPPVETTLDDGEVYKTYPNVALPNEAFERPENSLYFEVIFDPSLPYQSELGTSGRNRCEGKFIVVVNTPKDWGVTGPAKCNDCYDAIAKIFRRGDIINGVRIVRTYRSSAMADDDLYSIPVIVQYWAELEN